MTPILLARLSTNESEENLIMRLISIVMIGLVCACHQQERPKEVLNHEQLAALLVDVYLAEARTETVPKMRDSVIKYFVPYEQKLLKQHGITDSVMQITYSYYMQHTKELETIYDAVIDTLSLRESKAGKSAASGGVEPVPLTKPPTKKLLK